MHWRKRMAAIALAGGSLASCVGGGHTAEVLDDHVPPTPGEPNLEATRSTDAAPEAALTPLRARPAVWPNALRPPPVHIIPICNANPDPCCRFPDMCRDAGKDAGDAGKDAACDAAGDTANDATSDAASDDEGQSDPWE
jgi:hypothetical protein